MIRYEFFLTSALEKVLPSVRPAVMAEGTVLSAWRGAKAAVQLVYTAHGGRPDMTMQRYQLRVSGAPGDVRFREVGLMKLLLGDSWRPIIYSDEPSFGFRNMILSTCMYIKFLT